MSMLLLPQDGDRQIVENALPGFMLTLLFQSLRKEGYEVRMDLEELANKCSGAAVAAAPAARQGLLAHKVQSDGYAVLKNSGVEKVNELIGGLSRCLVKMQDQGRRVNPDALIVALGICAEIDDDVEDWGKPGRLNAVMSKIDNEFRKLGYFKVEITV